MIDIKSQVLNVLKSRMTNAGIESDKMEIRYNAKTKKCKIIIEGYSLPDLTTFENFTVVTLIASKTKSALKKGETLNAILISIDFVNNTINGRMALLRDGKEEIENISF